MDSLIRHFDAWRDGDLTFVYNRGIAYQTDMSKRVQYDKRYMEKVDGYDGNEIAKAVNAGRCAFMRKYVSRGSSVLDYGAGSGAFVRDAIAAGYLAKGFDIMPLAIERLAKSDLFDCDVGDYDVVTFWDSLEHMEDPARALKAIPRGAHVFASLPIFDDLRSVRQSKHYRPNEHLYYFSGKGFVDWMAFYGFRLLDPSFHEMEAGRESIGAFAFRKDLPDYHDHIAAYKEMHSSRFYGSSAAELHLNAVANVVRELKPITILDYGCGRSDLAAHFWRDGHRRIERYDPAIPAYKRMPEGKFDLVFCCDVMEHIPMVDVERVLREVRDKGDKAVFTISCKPSRARLPDGRNAHVTLLSKTEWMRWIGDLWKNVMPMPSKWEHELMVVATA